jgi:hypothetical protein
MWFASLPVIAQTQSLAGAHWGEIPQAIQQGV